MSYQPNPVDTSHIDLGQLDGLSEYLAEQAHEVWARDRMKQGWTWGAVRDDRRKHNPDLVKYADLPDSEKEYDRRMSSHTLKLIVERGFQLIPKDAIAPSLYGGGPPERDEIDMDDTKEIAWLRTRIANGETALQPLADRLQWLAEELEPSYKDADKLAAGQEKAYLWASFWCLICAAVAVFLAIYQLAGFPRPMHPLVLPFTEFALVVIATVLVVADYQFSWKDSWLTNRSRAERLRSLKFCTLLNPKFWSKVDRPEVEADVRAAVRKIDSMSPEHLSAKLVDAELDPFVPDVLTGNPETDQAIGNYYLRRRLISQFEYAEKKKHEYHEADRRTRLFAPILLFGVLVCVFAHDAVDLVHYLSHAQATQAPADEDWSERFGRFMITLAAAIPAAGAALHVYRDGREAGRNHVRTMATAQRLSLLRQHLEGQRTRKEQIRWMVATEIVLASEHEQWIQLMKECEWYG